MAGIWKKALIYLGLVEEEDDLEPLPEVHEAIQLESVRPIRADSEPSSVRRISPQTTAPAIGTMPVTASSPARVHLIEPKSFEGDAKDISDKLRIDEAVILNLQRAEQKLSHDLFYFAQGVTSGLGGSIDKIADRVFLLTPANVEVTVEERQRIISERGFFNEF